MDSEPFAQNPYQQALKWVEYVGFGTGGGSRMAKLLLSLYNTEFYAISAGECLCYMDETGRAIALRCLAEYASQCETAALRQVGEALTPRYPGLNELCAAASEARTQVYKGWEDERRRQRETAPEE